MAGMVGASPHLPSVTGVSVDTLFLVVMLCSLVEVRRLVSQRDDSIARSMCTTPLQAAGALDVEACVGSAIAPVESMYMAPRNQFQCIAVAPKESTHITKLVRRVVER